MVAEDNPQAEGNDETDVLLMLLRGMEAGEAAKAAKAVAKACGRDASDGGRSERIPLRQKQRETLTAGSGVGGGAAARQPLAVNRPQWVGAAPPVMHW